MGTDPIFPHLHLLIFRVRDTRGDILLRSPSVPYVLPFAVFIALLAGMPLLGLSQRVEFALWVLIVGAVLLAVSRPVIDLSVRHVFGSLAVGVAVFAVWIAPDVIFPGYRDARGTPIDDPVALALRVARAVLIVPIAEELFWRAWLPRWLIRHDFRVVPLGAYTPFTFAATALLFAVEHAQYWDVGLIAGAIYNAWMWRSRRLGDCILAHAVTNGCLAADVIIYGEWRYW